MAGIAAPTCGLPAAAAARGRRAPAVAALTPAVVRTLVRRRTIAMASQPPFLTSSQDSATKCEAPPALPTPIDQPATARKTR